MAWLRVSCLTVALEYVELSLISEGCFLHLVPVMTSLLTPRLGTALDGIVSGREFIH
jgi:hypothetical protein